MENSYKYSVAGHIFRIVLPEGYTKEDCLGPYSPFEIADDAVEPLFTLKVELTTSLRSTLKGSVKEIFNE